MTNPIGSDLGNELLGMQSAQQSPTGDVWEDVKLEQFIELLVAELSNQDPMQPMTNQEMLQQVTQIQEIASNKQLSSTLESVMLGQNVGTAANMIGRTIMGMTDEGDPVTGAVDRISIVDGVPQVHVGPYSVRMENISDIYADAPPEEEAE